MPPRLRPSDYAKGKLAQDEIIALQIANDKNIADARKAVKLGEPEKLTQIQASSPAELLADLASQEATARTNLEKLGFRPQEAAQIVTNIRVNNDPNVTYTGLNMNFPAIEADISKRFDKKLLTPAFFIEYFTKYSEQLAAARGERVFNPNANNQGLNGLINNVAELRAVIPDPAVIEFIRRAAEESRIVGQEMLRDLDRLRDILPSEASLRALANLDPVRQQAIIERVLVQLQDMPSEAELRRLANLIQADQLDRRAFFDAVRGLIDAIPQGRQQNIVQQELGVPIQGIPVAETMEEAIARRNAARDAGRPPPPVRPVVAIQWLGDIVNTPDQFQALRIGDKKSFINQVGLGPYLRDADGRKIYVTNLTNANWQMSNAMDLVLAWLTLKGRVGNQKIADAGLDAEFRQLVGQGISPKIRMKVGRGIDVKQVPSYRAYGKYAIHMPQLEQQDLLNVKYKSLGQIPKFRPIAVSDVFKDFLVRLLETGKPDIKLYQHIPTEERKFFEEMSLGAGVWNGLGLKRTTISRDNEENKRFEILRGEYMAGNNSSKVIGELRQLVVKMMGDGRIRKSQGVDLLMELSV